MKRLLLCLLVISFAKPLNAQDSTLKVPKFKATDAFVHFGGFNESGTLSTFGDFKKLAPGSELLKMDLSDFDEYPYDGYYNGFAYGASVGFRIRNKEGSAYKRTPMLRVGLMYRNSYPYEMEYHYHSVTRYDTLTGSYPNNTIFVDSALSKTMSMDYSSDELRLDLSITFSTNPDARWALYGGAGLTLGFTFNNNTYIHYGETNSIQLKRVEGGSINYYDYYSNYSTGSTETFKNKTGFAGSFYAPIGVDFRIARRGEFFKRLHLFYELRTGINITNIPELGTTTRLYFNNVFGLRVNF